MKRVVAIAVAIALCVSLCVVLASCGASEDAEAEGYEDDYEGDDEDEDEGDYETDDEGGYETDDETDDEGGYEADDEGGYETDDEGGYETEEEGDYETEEEYEDKSAGGGNTGGTFYSGMAGDESTIFAVCLSVSPDGTQCVLAYGSPGASIMVLGQYSANRNNITIKPLDGSDEILLSMSDNADGSISIEFVNDEGEILFDGVMESVSESKFTETLDMLS